jgi:Ydr279p protein family (RNase H2 complex component) wHTH domain/Ydr279p protein triple barrel domain
MGVTTRPSASSSPVKSKISTKIILPSAEQDPYKTFILPKGISSNARFVLLKDPRDATRRRFLFCPQNGLYEITKTNSPGLDPRSILFAPDDGVTSGGKDEGYVNKTADIFVATRFDPVFLLLPVLDRQNPQSRADSGQGLFQPLDDLLEEHVGEDQHLRHVFSNAAFRPSISKSVDQVCDSVNAGDEKMYRLNMGKVHDYIITKAQRVVDRGLPASLEERFVTRALEMPMLSVKREETSLSFASTLADATPECATLETNESQSSSASTVASFVVSETSSATSFGLEDAVPPPQNLHCLQRLRTAMSFITASYLDPKFAARLTETSSTCKTHPDFAPLDSHLKYLAKLRAEALATRSLSDFCKKRNLDDDEASEDRAEKKRKQEEEEKRKKSQESRGVRDLKKVNVSGMKKMSEFFAKKTPAVKPKS